MNTKPTNTRTQNTVRVAKVVEIAEDGEEAVYNMEVDETHCFAVNGGLIVHNCMDSTRYFVNTIMRHKVREDGKKPSIFDQGVIWN